MEKYDYSETIFGYLTFSLHDVDLGPVVKQYRLDKSNEEYYFFRKCPEKVLEVEVYHFLGGEFHQVDSTSFTARRYLYMPLNFTGQELDELMIKKGFEKKSGKYESRHLVAYPYKEGIVYASKSCGKNLGEDKLIATRKLTVFPKRPRNIE
jgi:hypothetical protein